MPPAPSKLRKAYINNDHPQVMLRFEDGHEIRVAKGTVKTFDVYPGEVVRVLAVYDSASSERELLQSIKSDELPDADTHESR
jgi:hypothetical protein